MQSHEIREKFLKFFESKGHIIAKSSSVVPEGDSSVLFTTAGMQQFKPYYLGEKSPFGDKVVSVQKCIRTNDIEEVGDDTHLTFFEMLGNFAFNNAVSKKEAITWAYEFITKDLGLAIDYVTVFGGDDLTPKDEESAKIWQEIDPSLKIKEEGREDVFWGPTGDEGPCGPTTEIYINGVEIWNIVFNEYFKDKEGNFAKLQNFGIDTGMGLERLLVQVQGKYNVYDTDLFDYILEKIPKGDKKSRRVIADHIRSACFLISDGVVPTNKDRGYILRRLLRSAIRHAKKIGLSSITLIFDSICLKYKGVYDLENQKIRSVIEIEEKKFLKTLEKGLKIFLKKMPAMNLNTGQRIILELSGDDMFTLFTEHGFPVELIIEEAKERDIKVLNSEILRFNRLMKEHQDKSRAGAEQKFKGGLAGTSEATVRLHTAHHLLLAALQKVLGPSVKQRGSNITEERLRIDFSFDRKMTDEEKAEVEKLVNEAIEKDYKVIKREMPKSEAEKIGAEMEFGAKYDDLVSVYFVEDENGNVFSKEFCGGPHVERTGVIGKFKIQKEKASSAGIRRIKATLL